MTGERRLAIVLVMTLAAGVLLPAAGATPWLQAHGGADRVGASDDRGPMAPEIAFRVELPGEPVPLDQPIVMDGVAYVLTRAYEPASDEALAGPGQLTFNGVVAVDLATAAVREVVALDAPPSGLASDGGRLFLSVDSTWQAIDPASGSVLWESASQFAIEQEDATTICVPPAVTDDVLYTGCWRFRGDEAQAEDPADGVTPVGAALRPTGDVVVEARAVETGEVLWSTDQVDLTTDQNAGRRTNIAVTSLAVGPTTLYVSTEFGWFEALDEGPRQGFVFLDRSTGALLGGVGSEGVIVVGVPVAQEPQDVRAHFAQVPVAIVPPIAITKFANLEIRDAATANLQQSVPTPDSLITYGDEALAVRDGIVYVATVRDLFAIDIASATIRWQAPYHYPYGLANGQLVVTEATLFVIGAEPGASDGMLIAFDPAAGTRQWHIDLPGEASFANRPSFALADDALVMTLATGSMVVIGRTAASIVPSVSVSNPYPAPGENITIDLSATTPGLLAEDLAFAVAWTTTGGAPSFEEGGPVFSHRYDEPGLHDVHVRVTNGAGQVAYEVHTVDVGGTPPPEPNAIETAFARENQDLTFGLLGLAVALAGGAIAVGRTRRRRGRLQREIEAVDAAAAATRDDATRLRATLEERRAHGRGLVLDGKLDEAQFTVLNTHIDAVGRGARMGEVRELFDFLPYAMVTALEEMLTDGRITAWERESFHALLAQNSVLTAAQKRKVGALIDAWFAQDVAGA